LTRQTSRGGTPEIIAVGAEAVLAKYEFLGRPAIYKVRVKKPYRDPRLDERLRRERTFTESRIMNRLRTEGLPVPALYLVDPKGEYLVMEFIEGELLKNMIVERREFRHIVRELGRVVARMHELGVVHGDLTTSNVIVRGGRPYLIDFGLARFSDELEDIGVDIHLFLRAVESTHYELKDEIMKEFLKGYGEVVGEDRVKEVMDKVHEIRLRGRYVEERRKRRG